MKKLTLIVTELPSKKISYDIEGNGFTELEIIGILEEAKTTVLNNRENNKQHFTPPPPEKDE